MEIRLQIYAEVFGPWFRHEPPFGDYPLGITSVCQQTRHQSSPLMADGFPGSSSTTVWFWSILSRDCVELGTMNRTGILWRRNESVVSIGRASAPSWGTRKVLKYSTRWSLSPSFSQISTQQSVEPSCRPLYHRVPKPLSCLYCSVLCYLQSHCV